MERLRGVVVPADHVVERDDVLEALVLRSRREIANRLGVVADLVLREDDADLHAGILSRPRARSGRDPHRCVATPADAPAYDLPVQAALGILAGILQLVASAPYVRDVLRGSTKPQRATWTIWAALSFVVLASQWADGATWSLALTLGQTVSCVVIFALALRRGVGGVSPVELAMLAIATLGIAGWYLVDDPTVATCSVVVADVIAVGLMLPKTYREPRSETLSTYLIGLVSTVLAIAAVGADAPSLLIYPLYILVADGAVAGMIALRRRAPAPALS